MRHLLLLREKLGLGSGGPPQHQDICKWEKEACNLVARAAAGRSGAAPQPAAGTPTSPPQQLPSPAAATPTRGVVDESVYAPWEMTPRERELATRTLGLILSHIPSKPPPTGPGSAKVRFRATGNPQCRCINAKHCWATCQVIRVCLCVLGGRVTLQTDK